VGRVYLLYGAVYVCMQGKLHLAQSKMQCGCECTCTLFGCILFPFTEKVLQKNKKKKVDRTRIFSLLPATCMECKMEKQTNVIGFCQLLYMRFLCRIKFSSVTSNILILI
jgi:hypothetical protein